MSIKKVQKFSLYLYWKYGINSLLKMQKILFFLRVYEKMCEKKNKINSSPIFDSDNGNFQAWMYGPVNIDSYYFMRPKFYDAEDETNDDILSNRELLEKYKPYEPIIKKLNEFDSQELVYYSHHNIEYKNVRKPLKEFDPCDKELDENNVNFTKFDDEVNQKINKIFSDIK